MNNGYASSSPPTTPPSPPLPISVGPGCHKYDFSSSSPTPFSLPSSPLTSTETLPLLSQPLPTPPAFPMDLQLPQAPPPAPQHKTSSCIKDLLEWLVLRCCRNCPLPI